MTKKNHPQIQSQASSSSLLDLGMFLTLLSRKILWNFGEMLHQILIFNKMVAGVDVPTTFEHLLKSEPELATAVAAIKTLILVLERCTAKTLQELIKLLKEATEQMKTEVDCSACSVTSGCELFLRFITLAARLEEEVFYFSFQLFEIHSKIVLHFRRLLKQCDLLCYKKETYSLRK